MPNTSNTPLTLEQGFTHLERLAAPSRAWERAASSAIGNLAAVVAVLLLSVLLGSRRP